MFGDNAELEKRHRHLITACPEYRVAYKKMLGTLHSVGLQQARDAAAEMQKQNTQIEEEFGKIRHFNQMVSQNNAGVLPLELSDLPVELARSVEKIELHKRNIPQLKKGWYLGSMDKNEPLRVFTDEDLTIFRYLDVSFKSTSMIVCNSKLSVNDVCAIEPTPNFVVSGDGEIHVFWLLKQFVHENAPSSLQDFLMDVIGYLASLAGDPIDGDPVLNPFSILNETRFLTDDRRMLNDLRSPVRLKPEELKKRQIESGKRSSNIRIRQSLKKICDAIKALKVTERSLTRIKVAQYAGLGEKTVRRHWEDEAVQTALKT